MVLPISMSLSRLPDVAGDSAAQGRDSSQLSAPIAISLRTTDQYSVTGSSQPDNGTVTVLGKGSLSYQPDPGFQGLDYFTYTLSDGNGSTSIATVEVTVPGLDDSSIQIFSSRSRTAVSRVGPNAICSPIQISGMTGLISDMNAGIDIAHSGQAKLAVALIAPDGTRLHLFTDVTGFGENDAGTVPGDAADTDISRAGHLFPGVFRTPKGALSRLNGLNPNGVWTLEIRDDAGADEGVLNNWFLELSTI